jgi:D-alanyl-D-alanine carboxypeptidase
MRKQMGNLKLWHRPSGLLLCAVFLCLLLPSGCSRYLGSNISKISSPSVSKPGDIVGGSGGSVGVGSSAGSANSGNGAASPPLSSASQVGAGGVAVGEGLNSLLVLVNREHALPADYIPADLTKLTLPFASYALPERRQLRKEAAEAIVLLFEAAENDKIELFCYSGYRSYPSQSEIYTEKVRTIGLEETNKYYAAPGHSEHQTGLAMDVTNAAGLKAGLNADFAQSKEGIWLAANANRFGFIIRYPQGKEGITGYAHEPWHLRYVGLKAALEIGKTGQTLEEYLQ